jgi:uncharacterized protein with gpF-like domain
MKINKNQIELLMKEVSTLEILQNDLSYELETLAHFACPSYTGVDKDENTKKYYQVKRDYESARKRKNNLLDKISESEREDIKQSNKFINSFGEATQRYITNSTYEKQQNRLSKDIMQFIR